MPLCEIFYRVTLGILNNNLQIDIQNSVVLGE